MKKGIFAITLLAAVEFSYWGTLEGSADWKIGPFERADQVNPIICPQRSCFSCPLQNKEVFWEVDHTFNPGAVARNDKIYIFYRAEDDSGQEIGKHTSRLGLAVSTDGLHFQRVNVPILFPDSDDQYAFEWPGGCEDPRIVEKEDGTYVMTYTQWNHELALLAIASSKDLIHWKKHGYAFARANNGTFNKRWSKSGSIVCHLRGERLVAVKIQGKYWMFWGEGVIRAAVSDDLISWEPLLDQNDDPIAVLDPRPGKHDSELVEPGPPAILTKEGIVLLYNGKNSFVMGDPSVDPGAYSAGQLLLDAQDPTKILDRTEESFFKPERPYEKKGQYKEGTVFIQGLVYFQGKWFLYYGGADSIVGVAIAEKGVPK